MYKKDKNFRGDKSKSFPRAQRMSSQDQQDFKDKRSSGASPSFRESNDTGRSNNRSSRPMQKLPDNVSLSLSPKMLELADELASKARMPLRTYLTEALKYVILAQGKRLGATEKYLPEFVNQNQRKTTSWKPGSERSNSDDSAGKNTHEQAESVENRYREARSQRWGGREKFKTEYGSESDRKPQGAKRPWGSREKFKTEYGSESDRKPQGAKRPWGSREKFKTEYGSESDRKPEGAKRPWGSKEKFKTEYGSESDRKPQGAKRPWGSREKFKTEYGSESDRKPQGAKRPWGDSADRSQTDNKYGKKSFGGKRKPTSFGNKKPSSRFGKPRGK